MVFETICRVSLKEIQRVRVMCRHCHKAGEYELRHLATMKQQCPFCNADLYRDSDGNTNHFNRLYSSINSLSTDGHDLVSVEFIIDESPESPAKDKD